MNNVIRLFSPYGLLYIGVYLEYFPPFFRSYKPSISLGPVDLSIIDVALVLLCMKTLLMFLNGRAGVAKNKKGRVILILFGVLFLYGWVKWGLQSDHSMASIRMTLVFLTGYLFLALYPMHANGKKVIQQTVTVHTAFLLYIFTMHIYAFASQGFKMHILTGEFLTILSLLYFLLIWDNKIINLSSNTKLFLRCIIIATYIMVGHRSAFIALMLGLSVYAFSNKSRALKELVIVFAILLGGTAVSLAIAPDMVNKLADRASTTFDVQQDTYQGRFDNIIPVLQASANNLFLGKELTLRETISEVTVKSKKDWRVVSEKKLVLTPHNLILEWIYYYGLIGLSIGCLLLFYSAKFLRDFMKEVKGSEMLSGLPIIILCCLVHNIFWAFTNVTTMSVYGVYFLYLPILLLIVVARNKKIFDRQDNPEMKPETIKSNVLHKI